MTIKEIAERANVSLGTVDRVIHNRGKVANVTKEKILKILKDSDYKPNVYARGLVLNKSFNIAAVLPRFNSGEYWEIPSKGIEQAFKDLNQFGINVNFFRFDQNDIQSFVSAVTKLLDSNPDGVILAPVINFEAINLTKKLKKLDIPFSIIDSNLVGNKAISFIGQDSFQSGRLAAMLLNSILNGCYSLSIVSIKNNENHNDTLRKRIEGFKKYFSELINSSKFHIIEIDVDQRKENWKQELEDILKEKKPDGIYVPSSKVHYVAEILDKNNLNSKLVGNDLIANNIHYVESGIINYVIGQRPETQGYLALESFYKHLVTKQKITKEVYLPLDIITKENLKYYKSQIAF